MKQKLHYLHKNVIETISLAASLAKFSSIHTCPSPTTQKKRFRQPWVQLRGLEVPVEEEDGGKMEFVWFRPETSKAHLF
jgi:hypothetical protein